MVRVNYRVVTLVAAIISAVGSASTLGYLVTAIVDFRASDFLFASKTLDFHSLGTCVETLTESQIDGQKYNVADRPCGNDRDAGRRGELRDALSVSIHGMWYTHYTSRNLSDASVEYEDSVWHVLSAMITHVMNEPDPDTTTTPMGINFTTGHAALTAVANVETGIPASCDTIYDRTWSDIEADSALLQFIEDIRDGRLDNNDKTKETWPLTDLVIDCNFESTTSGGGLRRWADVETGDDPTIKAWMHAHCYAQFLYASVGSKINKGTQSIPTPGIVSGPRFDPYPKADGFNSTSSYNTKARMYLGQRFGYSVWAYVPMFLATCYLLADSVVFFFAEAMMPYTLSQQPMFSTTPLNQMRDSLVIMATGKSSRRLRLSIGFLAVIVSCIFYTIFIAAPWGVAYSTLPRPECEKNAVTGMGTDPNHGNIPLIGWKGTKGGWKADYDAAYYDLATLATQIFVLMLLPLTTTSIFRKLNTSLNDSGDGRIAKADIKQKTEVVNNSAKFRLMQSVFTGLMVLGIAIIIIGQSISGARFGFAWAEGVVAEEDVNRADTGFDTLALSEAVYDQTMSTIALVVACSLVFGVVIQRHLFAGAGCFSAALLFGWILLVGFFFIPITYYAANRSIFNEKQANRDCAFFSRESHKFANDLCSLRFWTLIIGGGIFVGTIVAIIGLTVVAMVQALFEKRKKAAVYRQALISNSSAFRSTGPDNSVQGGYRSNTENFFNFHIKKEPNHHQLLHSSLHRASLQASL